MRLVYKYIYKGNKADTERILHYCEVSKNLYNQALYVVKQSLKENKFLFYNDIEKHEVYQGKRIRRGLYQSSVNKLINADVNGALNIMRKVFNDSAKRIIDRELLFNPLKLKDLWHLPLIA